MPNTVLEARQGDRVRVRLALTCEDGREFGAPPDELDLEFTVGSGEAIPGLEQASMGMRSGRSGTVGTAVSSRRALMICPASTDAASIFNRLPIRLLPSSSVSSHCPSILPR